MTIRDLGRSGDCTVRGPLQRVSRTLEEVLTHITISRDGASTLIQCIYFDVDSMYINQRFSNVCKYIAKS